MLIAHVISSLNDGGAEAVLYRLCTADTTNRHLVFSLRDDGKYGPMLTARGIQVYCLHMPRGRLTIIGFIRLLNYFLKFRPNVIQTWMYHADLVGGLAGRLAKINRVFWGVHNTNLNPNRTNFNTVLVARTNAWLSRFIPMHIVSCSRKGVETHVKLGYSARKFVVIENGFNFSNFSPNNYLGLAVRKSLDIPDDIPLLAMVARFDPQKDHLNLLAALNHLNRNGSKFVCLLVGEGMDKGNSTICSKLEELELTDCVYLLGPRNDIPALMNAIDLHVLSSVAEAFPNVLCEAMACGTPCVTTDVGDAMYIVGDTGWCVPPNSPEILSNAMAEAITEMRKKPANWEYRQGACRKRMVDNFSIDLMVKRYNETWSVFK